jgi:hypothetical protein
MNKMVQYSEHIFNLPTYSRGIKELEVAEQQRAAQIKVVSMCVSILFFI